MTRQSRQSGFTLIEALVALMILAIAATSIIAAFGAGARQSASRMARYDLYSQAQARLSLLKAEVKASAAPIDRQFTIAGRLISESSQIIAVTDAPGSALALYEISVVMRASELPNARFVRLSDFVMAETFP